MNALMWFVAGAILLFLGYASYRAPRLTSALWWSFTACIFGTAAAIIVLPGDVRDRLLWTAFCIPFIWVALQFWCYWDARPWRVTSSLIVTHRHHRGRRRSGVAIGTDSMRAPCGSR